MTTTLPREQAPPPGARRRARVVERRASSLTSQGEPVVWLMGGALVLALAMIFGLLGMVVYHGGRTFWPRDILRIESAIGADFELLASFDRIEHPARGRAGGAAGAPGACFLASGAVLKGKGTQTIRAGERLVIHTPGGGGYGAPEQRDPRSHELDQRRELVGGD